MRISYTSYLATTLDYRESHEIDATELKALVVRLRAGDESVIHTIIKGHYRLVAGIVGESVRSKKQVDDMMGAALLGLTEAVHRAARGSLRDDNVTYYITNCVRYVIKEARAKEHVMRMPSRTVRDRISKGEKFEDIVPGGGCEIREDSPSIGGSGDGEESVNRSKGIGSSNSGSDYVLPFIIPLARPEHPSLEFKEALSKAAVTPMEQAIVNLRSEGFGYAEIGAKVGLSTQRVGQIMPKIEARFDAYYEA